MPTHNNSDRLKVSSKSNCAHAEGASYNWNQISSFFSRIASTREKCFCTSFGRDSGKKSDCYLPSTSSTLPPKQARRFFQSALALRAGLQSGSYQPACKE
uniref:Uncharacterized protein n=1 Tax=Panagrellus redivivus TaxID=6233 RepID=A0A7E5A084_PANRE